MTDDPNKVIPLTIPEVSEAEQYVEMINMVKEANTNLELQLAKLKAANKKLIQMCTAQHAELEALRSKAPKMRVVNKPAEVDVGPNPEA